MKKFLCVIAALSLICAGALADGSAATPGSEAGTLGGDVFFALSEGENWALAHFSADDSPHIAERAEYLGDLVTADGALFYLRTTYGERELMKRDMTGGVVQVCSFGASSDVRALSARGETLFALIDDMLHIIYPDDGIYLKLAGAHMSEYVIVGDYAYYISLTNTLTYTLPLPGGGIAESTAGRLYKLNLSTGITELVFSSGAEDLQYANEKLYFHNMAQGYTMERGNDYWVAGELCALSIDDDELVNVGNGYDWDYWAVTGGVVLFRDGELFFRDDNGHDVSVCATGAHAEVTCFADYIVVFEPGDLSFSIYTASELAFVSRP